MAEVDLTYCVVNTEQRELLVECLDAVAREREACGLTTEVLVLDNASTDGSAGAARNHLAVDDVIALEQRAGKGENDSALLQRARGRYGLLLNEDAVLQPGATRALYDALESDLRAGTAGARLRRPGGEVQPSAWRFPGVFSAIAAALWLHRLLTVQSRGNETRRVDWAQSSALLVRRAAAEEIGWFDPQFFVYSDEVDFCKRLRNAGWHTLWVPSAEAVHHEQLSTNTVPEPRIVEFSRNRDRYLRKHHGSVAACVVRVLTAWTYAVRAAAAVVVPGHSPKRYWRHVTATLRPGDSEGLRETAAHFNRGGPTL
ncbi:MAG: glycosyltransferase family 2 protein [Baekduia sp.]